MKALCVTHLALEMGGVIFGGSLSTNRLQGPGVPLAHRLHGLSPEKHFDFFHAVNFIKADSGSDIWKLNEWGVLSMN